MTNPRIEFIKAADRLREECRQRKLARERARQEVEYLLSDRPALSLAMGLIRRRYE